MTTLRALLAAVVAALPALTAYAEFPMRPVRIVVPLAAGGPADSVARTIAPALAARLGQPVVVENKPGADGAIAGQAVAMSAADGYTLLYAITATAALPLVSRTTYDMKRDFTPVSTIGTYDFGMFVSTAVPATTVQEFVDYANTHPGQVNFATLNMGEYHAAALFMRAAGVRMTRVPYRSMSQILPDLVADQVQVNFGPLLNGIRLANDGRTRVLATLSPERTAFAPGVPTMREAGFPAVTFESVQMLFAPAKTPQDVVERLSREINAVLRQPDVQADLEALTLRVRGSTPEQMGREQDASYEAWARFAIENHMRDN
jgi:tripartite-type tricarboxylate transporter receptor subunit TctC